MGALRRSPKRTPSLRSRGGSSSCTTCSGRRSPARAVSSREDATAVALSLSNRRRPAGDDAGSPSMKDVRRPAALAWSAAGNL